MGDKSASQLRSVEELLEQRKRYMRTLNNCISSKHHLEFLTKCSSDHLTPRGLRLHLNVNVIGQDHEQLDRDIDTVLKTAESDILALLIDFYKRQSESLQRDANTQKQLMQVKAAKLPEEEKTKHHQEVNYTERKAEIRSREQETTRLKKHTSLHYERTVNPTLTRTGPPQKRPRTQTQPEEAPMDLDQPTLQLRSRNVPKQRVFRPRQKPQGATPNPDTDSEPKGDIEQELIKALRPFLRKAGADASTDTQWTPNIINLLNTTIINTYVCNKKKYICNLSTYSLSNTEYSVLSKGLKFIPTPHTDVSRDLEESINKLANDLRRTYYFHKHPTATYVPHPFKPKSSWQAPRGHTQLEEFISTLKTATDELPHLHTHPNLSKEEHIALRSLSNNPDLTIKMADKGSKIVVQDTSEYLQSGIEHLSDTSIYCKLASDPTQQIHGEIQSFLEGIHEQGYIDTITRNYFKLDNPPRTQLIYFLKKLHKNPIAVRPIVSGIGGPTEKISSFLDHYLQPVVCKTPSYLKNTKELLTILNSTTITDNTILCTIDVKSLYLSIPQEEGTTACLKYLEQHGPLPLPKGALKHLFDIVLKYNVFRFNDTCYKQIQGTAMGTKMAPAYAGIFMANLEGPFLDSCTNKPTIFKRYIDDIFVIWEHGQEALDHFLHSLNSIHPTIKFTWETSTKQITFLDVDIYIKRPEDTNPTIAYKTHFKQTNSFQYIHHSSFHPRATKKGIIKGEMTRIKNTTSDPTQREDTINFIAEKFKERDYPTQTITDTKNSLTSTTQKRQLSSILKIPYVRRSHLINKLVKQCWNTTVVDQSLHNIFPTPPLVVYTRSKNIANYLVRSASPGSVEEGTTTDTLPKPTLPRRVHPCGHAQCKCCPQLYQTYNLKGIALTQHLNCCTRNVIYLIKCRKHPIHTYVGQTERQLNHRLRGHRATFLNPKEKAHWKLYRHFSNRTHVTQDILISPLISVPKRELSSAENYWINTLETYKWPGLNSYHSKDYLPL